MAGSHHTRGKPIPSNSAKEQARLDAFKEAIEIAKEVKLLHGWVDLLAIDHIIEKLEEKLNQVGEESPQEGEI